jgi:hypothetical protein
MNRKFHERIIMLMKQKMSFRSPRKFRKLPAMKVTQQVDYTNESTESQCDCSSNNRRPPEVTTQNRKAEWFRSHRRP